MVEGYPRLDGAPGPCEKPPLARSTPHAAAPHLPNQRRQRPGAESGHASITGTICGVRIEAIEEPLMREIRYLDKLVDEFAKGRAIGDGFAGGYSG